MYNSGRHNERTAIANDPNQEIDCCQSCSRELGVYLVLSCVYFFLHITLCLLVISAYTTVSSNSDRNLVYCMFMVSFIIGSMFETILSLLHLYNTDYFNRTYSYLDEACLHYEEAFMHEIRLLSRVVNLHCFFASLISKLCRLRFNTKTAKYLMCNLIYSVGRTLVTTVTLIGLYDGDKLRSSNYHLVFYIYLAPIFLQYGLFLLLLLMALICLPCIAVYLKLCRKNNGYTIVATDDRVL